jgi:hypothetical protein
MVKKDKKKKVKKTKAQWPTWSAPFQPGSNLHKFSQAMMKKGGLNLKGFAKLIKKTEAKATWILKCLRKGSAGGWSWDFDDSRDRYVITNVKLHRKEV